MNQTIRVSGLQMLVTRDVARNERAILEAIGLALRDGAEVLLTPEGSLSGYYAGFDGPEVAAAVDRVASAAREAGIGLALGTCYKEVGDGRELCYNQVRLYAADGQYVGFYGKTLRCSSLAHPGTGEMQDYVEGSPRTFDCLGPRVGVLICNDLWATPGYTTMPNPYLPWQLRRAGARLILHAINSGTEPRYRPFHEASVELWAYSLGIPIVEVNAAGDGGRPVNARSGVVGADGARLVVAPDVGEQYFTCELAIQQHEEEL